MFPFLTFNFNILVGNLNANGIEKKNMINSNILPRVNNFFLSSPLCTYHLQSISSHTTVKYCQVKTTGSIYIEPALGGGGR